jgi:hypothetical protein
MPILANAGEGTVSPQHRILRARNTNSPKSKKQDHTRYKKNWPEEFFRKSIQPQNYTRAKPPDQYGKC